MRLIREGCLALRVELLKKMLLQVGKCYLAGGEASDGVLPVAEEFGVGPVGGGRAADGWVPGGALTTQYTATAEL